MEELKGQSVEERKKRNVARAAKLGYEDAQHMLELMYYYGDGV